MQRDADLRRSKRHETPPTEHEDERGIYYVTAGGQRYRIKTCHECGGEGCDYCDGEGKVRVDG